MAAEENSWRTSSFRQSVVVKIDEAIQRSGMSTSKNSMEMENHVFQKAKTKEEYLGFVARLILHVREMNSKKAAGMCGPGGGNPAMPDPINALQTLARQGTGNNQMMGMGGPQSGGMVQQPQSQVAAVNLLQSLNQRPGQGLSGHQTLQNKMPDIGMGPGSQVGNTAVINEGSNPVQAVIKQLEKVNDLDNSTNRSVEVGVPTKIRRTIPKQNDSLIDEATHTLPREEDHYDIFGTYIASEMRNLKSDYLRRNMKRKIQQVVLEISKEEEQHFNPNSIICNDPNSLIAIFEQSCLVYLLLLFVLLFVFVVL